MTFIAIPFIGSMIDGTAALHRHTMAVTETMGWYNMNFLQRMFHESYVLVKASINPRLPFPLLKEVSFVPYVCSELFF